jgi:hypothetical protein
MPQRASTGWRSAETARFTRVHLQRAIHTVFGVGQDGVGYPTSGGFVDPIKAQLDAFAARIAAGEILVPTKP